MALSLKKAGIEKSKPAAAPAAQQAPAEQSHVVATGVTHVMAPKAAPASGSWFKRGNDTAKMLQQEEKRIEEKYSGMWRFTLDDPRGDPPKNRPLSTTAQITFVDGYLTQQGILDCMMYREHHVNVNGEWIDLVCIGEIEPCPICESGDEPALVGAFTVIDHREFKGQKGVSKDRPKLFIAKRKTIQQLQTLATPRGGIAGWRVQVSRVGEKAPKVGDVFDFLNHTDEAALRKQFVKVDEKTKKPVCLFVPANYEKELRMLQAPDLRKLGFGKGNVVGNETGPVDKTKASTKVSDQM